jgi:putative spermidine/putrescine transport system permease protein
MLAALLGYPVAYHLYTLRWTRMRATLVLIVLLPVMVSFVVTAFSWQVILGGNGLVNKALIAIGITTRPLRILSTNTGVVIVLAYTFVPFMIMNVYAALETIDPALNRSASILGASPGRVFRHVTLPLSLPGVLSGSLLVFSLALGAFVTPIIIGGSQVKTIPVLIFNFATGVYDWPGAAALAVLLLVFSVVATWLFARVFQRQFLEWIAPA